MTYIGNMPRFSVCTRTAPADRKRLKKLVA